MHVPVMANEVAQYLKPESGRTFVDCTLGWGGHSYQVKIKKSKVKIIGFDRDAEAIAAAKKRLSGSGDVRYIHDNFSNIKKHVKNKVDGALFDLGVSSYQIDEAARGFSYQKDGPLDMRMDAGQELTAADIVNRYPAGELEKLFRDFGEERFSRRIADRVVRERPVLGTLRLKEIVERAIPTWRKRESVARVFQALRIAVNSELGHFERALADSVDLLKKGGRIVVISYHSLEDRIAKRAFRQLAQDGIIKILTRKPVVPGEEESRKNPRARSAKLRAAEKC